MNSPYFQSDDFNGQYIVDHRESRNGSLQADYTPVIFTLKMNEIPNREVYVNGAFNLWQLNELNQMHYDHDRQVYEAMIVLKQGLSTTNTLFLMGIKSMMALLKAISRPQKMTMTC